jgi:hypothetical protein
LRLQTPEYAQVVQRLVLLEVARPEVATQLGVVELFCWFEARITIRSSAYLQLSDLC